jgi:hypothetical protein
VSSSGGAPAAEGSQAATEGWEGVGVATVSARGGPQRGGGAGAEHIDSTCLAALLWLSRSPALNFLACMELAVVLCCYATLTCPAQHIASCVLP